MRQICVIWEGWCKLFECLRTLFLYLRNWPHAKKSGITGIFKYDCLHYRCIAWQPNGRKPDLHFHFYNGTCLFQKKTQSFLINRTRLKEDTLSNMHWMNYFSFSASNTTPTLMWMLWKDMHFNVYIEASKLIVMIKSALFCSSFVGVLNNVMKHSFSCFSF